MDKGLKEILDSYRNMSLDHIIRMIGMYKAITKNKCCLKLLDEIKKIVEDAKK